MWLAYASLAAILAASSSIDADEATRLEGHTVSIRRDGGYEITDIAGEGRPIVGVVERRGKHLWVRLQNVAYRLVGPLAVARIAGPGYKVWVVGTISGETIRVRRIGVLRPAAARRATAAIAR